MRKKLGIDLDGVMYDFINALRTWMMYQYDYPVSLMPKGTIWDFWENWKHPDGTNWTSKDFLKFYCEGINAGWVFVQGNPLTGSIEVLCDLKNKGWELHVGTNREVGGAGEAAKINTKKWLHNWGVPYDTLTFTPDKTVLDVDFFIEDNIENYQALTKAGVDTTLITRDWNAHLNDAKRVATWEEYHKKLVLL